MSELESLKVSATMIVISADRKALIVQRPPDKTFANLWTVAGGKLQSEDGTPIGQDFRYFAVEKCAIRELKEETGIDAYNKELHFLCSIYAGQINRLIISFYVVIDGTSDEIKIKLAECQAYKWITRDQIKDYKFIPDIGGEIEEVFARLLG
jgi:8-oxo-dGTP pyrophosphatase MutT (NUDIX family)